MSIRLPIEVHEAEDRLIVDAGGYDVAEATYVEYAEFIVRACNSHADLLAALKESQWAPHCRTTGGEDWYWHECPCCGADQDDGHDEDCKLAAAIAKAEGD